jgi:putative transposase
MPRVARLRFPGYPLHIVQRGHSRARSFNCDADFATYMGLLEESCLLFPCTVHAYVLMPNHVHLLVTPQVPENISQVMRRVGQRYVRHFNKAYGRTGSIWEGRFKSFPVDSERYLLQCQRYIELNPVRAHLVERASDYPWSSYRCNAWGWPSSLVRAHSAYAAMVGEQRERLDWYLEFMEQAPDEAQLHAIRTGGMHSQVRTLPGPVPRRAGSHAQAGTPSFHGSSTG